MSWFYYAILCMAAMLVLALVAHIFDQRKHWAVKLVAILLAGLALYCHAQAEMNGEYKKLSHEIADPLVKYILQPFANSDLGHRTMNALETTIHYLNLTIRFIDDYKYLLTIGLTGLILLVVTILKKPGRR